LVFLLYCLNLKKQKKERISLKKQQIEQAEQAEAERKALLTQCTKEKPFIEKHIKLNNITAMLASDATNSYLKEIQEIEKIYANTHGRRKKRK
jgi:hypothetical protein